MKLPKSHHHILQLDNGSVTVIQERNTIETSCDYELCFTNEVPTFCDAPLIDFKTEERTKSYGELFLVRHGQTDSNLERKYQGSMDIPLSELGIKNMNLLAKSFTPNIPTRIICSPLSRAIQSAEIIANSNRIKSVSVRNDLHEFLYGIWEGMTEDEVSRYRHAEYNQWQTVPQKANIPQSEHLNNAYNRCNNIWEDYQKDLYSWGGSIISVAHDIVNRLIICNALDLPANYIWSFKQTNASVSVLAIKNVYDGRLRMLNHSGNSIKFRLSDEYL